MKVFFEGRLSDRRSSRGDVKEAPGKNADAMTFDTGTSEELYQARALIHDLDKQFSGLRETLHHRCTRIAQVKGALSELRTLLSPARGRWWRRWLRW